VIVDDDPQVRKLYQSAINDEHGFSCLRTYASCCDIFDEIDSIAADVIVMDVGLPGMSGCECLCELRRRGIRIPVLMLTAQDDGDLLFKSLENGASGYLLKGLTLAELTSAISEAYESQASMSPDMARRISLAFQSKKYAGLTIHELQLLQSRGLGDTYREISDALGVSKERVKQMIYNIYSQLVLVMGSTPIVRPSISEEHQSGNIQIS
jgi:DNA-binding NarL/FixJ family response regulator